LPAIAQRATTGAAFAALRFNLFASATTVMDRRYKTSRFPAFRFIQPPSSEIRSFPTSRPFAALAALRFLLLLLPAAAPAAITTYSNTWNVSTAIPDNDDVGYSNSQTVSVEGLDYVQKVTVDLTFTGGWNGDLYAYLVHDGGFAVLLNRPGRSSSATDGAGSVGLTITLDDSILLPNIHTSIPMSGVTVTGIYQTDGRNVDPLAVLDTDARTATLDSFHNVNGNGTWTLFVADQSPGDTSTLQSWGLNITAVPEPSAALMGVIGVLVLMRRERVVKPNSDSTLAPPQI
jgi:subtilisin-like proprotein convertase family protein